MSKSVSCIIIDCKSNAFKDLDVKFFKFPTHEHGRYKLWLDICYGSANAIRKHPRSYICSKHFQSNDFDGRRLAHNAVPALHLNNPPRCIVEQNPTSETDLTPAQLEKTHLVKLLNDTVLEWAKRSQHYSLISIPKSELIKVATKVRKLLGPRLTLSLDNYWCNRFRSCLSRVEPYYKISMRHNTLDLKEILKELDPYVTIYSETDIQTSERNAEAIKLRLNESSGSTEPKHRDGLNDRNRVGVFRCEFTSKPKVSEDDGIIGSLKFSGKRYVRKAKTSTQYSNKKGHISDSKPETNTSSKGVTNYEKAENICDNYGSKAKSEFREDSNVESHLCYPKLKIKSEVMDEDSLPQPQCSVIKFINQIVKAEPADGEMNNECNINVNNELEQNLSVRMNPLSGLKMEVMSDDESTILPDCNVSGVLDNVNKDTFLKYEKIDQPDSSLHKIPEKFNKRKSLVKDRIVQPDNINKFYKDKVIVSKVNKIVINNRKYDESPVLPNCNVGRGLNNVNKDSKLLENKNIAQPDSSIYKASDKFKKNKTLAKDMIVRPDCNIKRFANKFYKDKVIVSNVNEVVTKVIKKKPYNTNKRYIDNFLNYVDNYGKTKPKLSDGSRVIVAIKNDTFDSGPFKAAQIKHSFLKKNSNKKDTTIQLKTLLKNVNPDSDSLSNIELDKDDNYQTEINSLSNIELDKDDKCQIEINSDGVNPRSGSLLNIQHDEDNKDQCKLKEISPRNDFLFEDQSDEDNNSQMEFNDVAPSSDSLLEVESNDKDPLCFAGYWSSDDSTSGEKPQAKIVSYKEALDYLKPLEDFVLRKEDYRAIGLVSNLEIHFKQRAKLQQQKK